MSLRIAGRHLVAFFAVVLAAHVLPAAAEYPERQVRIVVSLPPGSGADTTARFVAKHLSQKFGQPFVVENRPGANSFIAARAVAESPPDGYTIFVASNSPMVTNAVVFRQLPYDPVRDFAPLASIARFALVLVVPSSSPYRTAADLIAAARAAPGKLNYAAGTPTYQVAMELYHERHAIRGHPVPYKGTGPAVTDVASGNVDYSIAEISSVLPLIRAGKIRALGVASTGRLKDLPEVPTLAESGTPGFEVHAWTAVFAPARVPAPILARLADAIRATMASADGAAFIDSLGGTLFPGTPEQLREFQVSEIEATRRIVKATGIPVE